MIVFAVALLIAAIGFFLVRQLIRGQRLVSALAAKEADFRLLAEKSSDMVTRIGLDERMQYVSPSSARIVGWRAGQLTGTPALAGVNAEDLPKVRDVVAALKRGDMTEARLVYRSRHREAREVWIESTMQVTRNPDTGKIDGVVAISRDVTEQKNVEETLASLATLDALTGLANRRRFDERLQQEWARARRDGTPVSLLMIDVDHFKQFNDQYGHPAGDACLQAIATVLAEEAARPADLAARYGGEEFVLLLPNTEFTGCEQVAEKIRTKLRRMSMAHALNLPSESVTVSLGGATIRPNEDALAESASLVQSADRALYAAKERGRDRLVMAEPATASLRVEAA
jgi:diguanylate cyclase (GGDEF)-like protein/PAS domain S-box-containing protein